MTTRVFHRDIFDPPIATVEDQPRRSIQQQRYFWRARVATWAAPQPITVNLTASCYDKDNVAATANFAVFNATQGTLGTEGTVVGTGSTQMGSITVTGGDSLYFYATTADTDARIWVHRMGISLVDAGEPPMFSILEAELGGLTATILGTTFAGILDVLGVDSVRAVGQPNVTVPGSPSTGDELIFVSVGRSVQEEATIAWTAPTGATLVGTAQPPTGFYPRMRVWRKTHDGTSAYTFGNDKDGQSSTIITLDGQAGDVTMGFDYASGTAPNSPALDGQNGGIGLTIIGPNGAVTTTTQPATYTLGDTTTNDGNRGSATGWKQLTVTDTFDPGAWTIGASETVTALTVAVDPAGGGGGGGVPTSDPIAGGDVAVLLLGTQTPAAMHFGQAQGDDTAEYPTVTFNQNPNSDQWNFPVTNLWEKTSAPGTGQTGQTIELTVLSSHRTVAGTSPNKRTEFAFRGSGGSYDYDLTLGQTYWFWLRYYMPDRTGWPNSSNHISPWQFHSKVGGSPPSASYLYGDGLADITGRNDSGNAFSTYTGVSQPMDSWVTDIAKIKMNPGTSDGILQIWRNGTQIVNETGINFGYAGNDGYIKFGTYVFSGGVGAGIYNDLDAGTTYTNVPFYVAGSGLIDDNGYDWQDVEQHCGYHTQSSVPWTG